MLSTAICLVLAIMPAYLIARVQNGKLKRLLLIMVILPLFMGNAVRVAGWMVLLGDRGLVNAFLQAVGLTKEPVQKRAVAVSDRSHATRRLGYR